MVVYNSNHLSKRNIAMFCFHIYSSKTLRNISPVVATSKAACFEVVGSVPCRHATELTAFGGEQMEISPTDPKKMVD